VRTLREEATQAEKSKFMRHLLPIQSDKRHENVVSLVGVSLNAPPFLAVLEFCGVGDLKTFLQNATGCVGRNLSQSYLFVYKKRTKRTSSLQSIVTTHQRHFLKNHFFFIVWKVTMIFIISFVCTLYFWEKKGEKKSWSHQNSSMIPN